MPWWERLPLTPDDLGRGENYVPYEQLLPLLRPGITFGELGDAVMALCGLRHGPGGCTLLLCTKAGESFADGLRHGAWVLPEQPGVPPGRRSSKVVA